MGKICSAKKAHVNKNKIADKNEALFIGEVVSIYRIPNQKDGCIVTVKTSDGQFNFPKATCFGKVGKKALEYNIGDAICIMGFVQTKKKVLDDKMKYYESIVAIDVDKIDTGIQQSSKKAV